MEGTCVEHVVIEDYKLYNHKGMQAKTQSYSQLETPRLLGLLETVCYFAEVPLTWQMATDVRMYKEELLVELKYLDQNGKRFKMPVNGLAVTCNEHERMAYKHFIRWFDKNKNKWGK